MFQIIDYLIQNNIERDNILYFSFDAFKDIDEVITQYLKISNKNLLSDTDSKKYFDIDYDSIKEVRLTKGEKRPTEIADIITKYSCSEHSLTTLVLTFSITDNVDCKSRLVSITALLIIRRSSFCLIVKESSDSANNKLSLLDLLL